MARSQCTACSETFSSESGFNMHRTGSYGDPIYDPKGKVVIGYAKSERRCLTEDEMLQKKMIKNDKGIWTTGEFDASVFSKKE
ncbi:MAG: hypothetical protein AUF65_02380 [Chloroflexi bacterium 13_1_20CM_50_12]|nr:MAG: hypothetical protein AUF65_02380 [Chloroflexi bacterium 13_1_20CM_50_12]